MNNSVVDVCSIPELEVGHIRIVIETLRFRIQTLEGGECADQRGLKNYSPGGAHRKHCQPGEADRIVMRLQKRSDERQYKLRLMREALRFFSDGLGNQEAL